MCTQPRISTYNQNRSIGLRYAPDRIFEKVAMARSVDNSEAKLIAGKCAHSPGYPHTTRTAASACAMLRTVFLRKSRWPGASITVKRNLLLANVHTAQDIHIQPEPQHRPALCSGPYF